MDREVNGLEIDLPSRGLPYEGQIKGGTVKVSPMTTREEKALSSLGSNSGLSMVDLLISRCVHGTGDLRPQDLLVGDRAFLMMAIRAASFGQDYQFQMICDYCRAQFRHTVKIPDDLEVVYLKEGFKEPFSVTLPNSKIKLNLRLLRGSDEAELTRLQKTAFKNVDPSVDGDPLYSLRMVKHIVSAEVPSKDPEAESDTVVIENNSRDNQNRLIKLYESLISLDGMALRDALSEADCGVNTEIEFTCPSCKESFNSAMPVKLEFFRPGGNRGIRYL
jgi:hypothetical protein